MHNIRLQSTQWYGEFFSVCAHLFLSYTHMSLSITLATARSHSNELHKLQLTQVQRAPHRDKQSQDVTLLLWLCVTVTHSFVHPYAFFRFGLVFIFSWEMWMIEPLCQLCTTRSRNSAWICSTVYQIGESRKIASKTTLQIKLINPDFWSPAKTNFRIFAFFDFFDFSRILVCPDSSV